MPTQKRRIVYLSDEEWNAAKERGEAFGLSASGYIRKLIAWRQPSMTVDTTITRTVIGKPLPIERHVQEFRPVPKPSRK